MHCGPCIVDWFQLYTSYTLHTGFSAAMRGTSSLSYCCLATPELVKQATPGLVKQAVRLSDVADIFALLA